MSSLSNRNPLDTLFNVFKTVPPALTSGLALFMVILFFASVAFPTMNESLALNSRLLTNFELNRLTWYPMLHLNLLHLGLNLWAFVPLLSSFELSNGTVRTGVVLNVLATLTGLAYALIGLVFFPDASVLGSSAWVFSFMGYFTYLEQSAMPTTSITGNFKIPTWTKPFIVLIVTAIILPGSSFLGHLLGLVFGFLLAMGKLKFMVEPPGKVILWIEKRIDFLIKLIQQKFYYVKEADAIEIRKGESQSIPLHAVGPSGSGAGAASRPAAATASASPKKSGNPFQGQGNVLGNTDSN
ncbi:similar to Saccharomyces cerevisiae YPL246C RBD2 Possible rhomboid protease [Geotrichum candidum]|uniref:Rhomboid-type serine protease 2 n=1 Tax=Geotrichum candidum TaxID=1173061 RepID=A0A0J9XFQ4_GEOCN|nr:similar to Saccharomyces cerevisiae YPL246C RBD2 Possible rhomboid protease [Geotrichum candidum]